MRNCDILWKLTKVNESCNIPQYLFCKITHFCSVLFNWDVLCLLSLSLLAVSKYDRRILVSPRQFQNFELLYFAIVKVKNSNIADAYSGTYPKVEHLKVLHSGKLWPYPQTLDSVGKACQGQTHYLITKIRELRPQKVFIGLAPGDHKCSGIYYKHVSDCN